MTEAYWVSAHQEIWNEGKRAAYLKLADQAIDAAGGRFVAREIAAKMHENGIKKALPSLSSSH
ncbi:MAG: DUF1330 domain-containing protein [Rhodospirillales bacterium]|nr:DUF1330 domain-containing protein [Rhodospirillales bacterium]